MVRVWNLPNLPDFNIPDNRRFNAMNYELQSIITSAQSPTARFRNHPEVVKWRPRLGELRTLHDKVIVPGLSSRGYNHNSPLYNIEGIPYAPFNPSFESYLSDLLEITLRQVIDPLNTKIESTSKKSKSSTATRMMKEMFQDESSGLL